MRITGLFLLGLALALTGMTGTAAAQKKGPNFENLLKATAPQPQQGEDQDDAAAKREAHRQAIEDARQNAQKDMQGYDPELHGFMRFGRLICEQGYTKSEDGQKCVEQTPVEGGRWKNGRVICDNGRLKHIYVDGKIECRALPVIEDGYYNFSNLRCRGGKVPVFTDGELKCANRDEVQSTEDIVWSFNFCDEGFEARQRTCYEREDAAKARASFENGEDGGDGGGSGFNLTPYATEE